MLNVSYCSVNSVNFIILVTLFVSEFVSPICLPTFEYMYKNVFKGEVMYVAGWGKTDPSKGTFITNYV